MATRTRFYILIFVNTSSSYRTLYLKAHSIRSTYLHVLSTREPYITKNPRCKGQIRTVQTSRDGRTHSVKNWNTKLTFIIAIRMAQCSKLWSLTNETLVRMPSPARKGVSRNTEKPDGPVSSHIKITEGPRSVQTTDAFDFDIRRHIAFLLTHTCSTGDLKSKQ